MKNAFKKAFTGAVAVLTIVWSVGLANLPMTAQAASAGDVIKGTTLSTVYYYGSDGSRYAFPNEKSYFSWYTDFSDVVTLSDSALAAIPLAGNIVYRPGSRWIKIQSDPKTYAVTPEGAIRWIETEEVAEGLAGSDWNAFIDDVSDTFFVDYSVGTSLMSAADAYNGALVASGAEIYLVWDGATRLVSDAGMTANGLQSRLVLDGSGIVLSGITAGAALTSVDTELTDTAQLGGVVATEGGLSISLASTTPASTTVPSSADSVEFATFKMTATDGASSVDQMIFRLGGVGATTNISNSYLYEGNTRLTNSRSINSTTREVTFSSLGLDFTNGETKYVTVRVDVAAAATVAAGDTVYFSLVEATDVVTDSEVSGNFPISGNTMTFSDTVAGTLTVIDNGTITNPTLGQEGATIAKVKFSAATEGASIEQVMFDVDNAADHSNFQLYDGTTLLANGTVVGKKVTFVFGTPYVIAKGGDETLQVKADIGGEANDVISVAIEESADVMATGSIYGFNMGIDVTGFDQTGNTNCTTECSESTVQGGDLTFAFNGPSASDIAVDSNDVILLNFTITSANWTELQNLPISLTVSGADTTADDNDLLNNTAADANYTDITVRLEDGTAWMGPEELTTLATGAAASALDQTQTLTFDDYQTLQAGESFDLMLTVDVGSDTDLNADIVYASIIMASVTADDINGDSLVVSTDVVPTSTITGYSMTITTSSLTVNESSTPWTSTYIKGSSAASLVGYNFTAGTSHDITVSDVTFTGTGDSDGTFSNENDIVLTDKISSCSVYDGVTGSLVDGPEGVIDTSSVYTIPFTDFAWNLEAGETSKLIMKCNLANVAPDGTDVYKFFIGATNSAPVVTAQDEEGDSVTACYDVDDDGGTCATDASDDLAYDSVAATVPTITIAAAGTLTVAASADMPTSTIILGSSTGVTVSKIKFTSTSEAWVINKMTFANASTTPSAAVSDSVAAGITVSYTNSDGDTETSSGFLSGASVTFSGLDVYVAKDSSATVTVTLDTAVVDSTSIDGATIDLDFDSSAASEFNAVGADSGDTFDGTELSGSDPSANAMTIYKTKPTLSLASGSPSGAGIPGLNEVFRFNVAADSRGYVTLNEVTFKMSSTAGSAVKWHYCDDDNSASGISDADLTLYDVLDLGTALEGADTNWTFYDSSDGSVCTEDTDVIDYIVLDLTTPDVIAAGTTLTYSLYMDNTGASAANDDSLRIDLDIDANSLAGTAAHVGTDGTICWDDDAYDTGLYATLVKTLPVTGGTIVY